MDDSVEVITGLKGQMNLCLGGYVYSKQKDDMKATRWRCVNRSKLKCRGGVTTSKQYRNPTNFKPHSHPPNEMTKEVTKVRKQLRETWLGPDVESVEALEATLREAPDEVKGQLCTKLATIKRDIRRHRRLIQKSEAELEISAECIITEGEDAKCFQDTLEGPVIEEGILPLKIPDEFTDTECEDSQISAEGTVPEGRNGELRLESPGEDGAVWPYHGALGAKKPTPPTPRDIPSPATLQETGSVHDETSSSGNKEDDDDDEEEIDDLKTSPHDPERLKAFNMFVRLFVDENLDRIVPISKQPKEKIQAIIDSCTRQFPEFAERARKRIRTYLKSCRRNKRTRDSAWPESNRPTPAHLTSVQAEQILAQACENESHNAKRMRLGLDPVSQPMPLIPGSETPPNRPAHEAFSAANLASSAAISESKTQHPLHLNNNKPDSPNLAKVSEPPPASAISSISNSPLNGAATSTAPTPLYRPNFSQAFQRAAGPQPFPGTHLFPTPPFGAPGMLHNGPTDLSMKPSKPLLSHKLNPTEMAAVRQLITGYRESAAFLLRSAEELEQLLLQQP